MMQKHLFWVYMMSNKTRKVLYIGVTNDLQRRVTEHKNGEISGFTRRYRCHALVYFEEYQNIKDAIAREKELKGWLRSKKESLITTINPNLEDLAADWFL